MGSSAGRVACGGALGFGAAGVVDTLDGLADLSTELDAAELDAATAELSPEAALSSVPQAAIRPAQASPSIAADTR